MQAVDYDCVSSSHHQPSHGLQYNDDCVASIDNTNAVTTYHRDRQFNTIGLTDATATVVNLCAYTPYGDFTVTDGSGVEVDADTVDNEYWYTGRRLDKESGLWYFRARYFSSAMGTFVSRDPVGYVDGAGLYNGYFAMRQAIDPSGEVIGIIIIIIGGGLIGAIIYEPPSIIAKYNALYDDVIRRDARIQKWKKDRNPKIKKFVDENTGGNLRKVGDLEYDGVIVYKGGKESCLIAESGDDIDALTEECESNWDKEVKKQVKEIKPLIDEYMRGRRKNWRKIPYSIRRRY